MPLTHIRICVIAILASSILVNFATGMTAVILPVTLENNGIGTTLIGLCLSLELVAVFVVSRVLTPLMAKIGMGKTLIFATVLRTLALFLLSQYSNFYIWCALIFVYGFGSLMYLIALQSWINSIGFEKHRGLVVGLFGTSISVGMALGPLLFQFIPIEGELAFFIAAGFSAAAYIPLLLVTPLIPRIKKRAGAGLWHIVKTSPAIMGAGVFSGVMIFGILYFIVLYGVRNELTAENAAFLLTVFMAGSILLEMPISSLSDRFDRRYVIIVAVFMSMVCATYLPIAIYTDYLSWVLLFIWGGVSGAIYSICIAMVGERYVGDELVTANSAYALMDAVGGIIGTAMVGLAMTLFGADGLPYVIVLAGIIYFTYALTRYKIT